MGKLTLHARVEIALLGALLLGSCSSSGEYEYQLSDEERDEIADVAADVAYDVVLEHEKVTELESRVEELELRLGV